jgi:hypothetical protein
MSAIRPIPLIDRLLAATAAVNGLTLVIRNYRDVAGVVAIVRHLYRCLGRSRGCGWTRTFQDLTPD